MTSRVLVVNRSAMSNDVIVSNLNADKDNYVTFDNRYFTVSVQLFFTTSVSSIVEEIAETVEAVVCVVDEPKENFNDVQSTLDELKGFLDEYNPEIRIVFLNRKSTEFESQFLEWSVNNSFEFIKLKSGSDSEVDIMGDNEGHKRVRSALECHMWPYAIMKNSKSENDNKGTVDITHLEQLLHELDFESGDFEAMFSKMGRIKNAAAGLPDEERKMFAEKVALTFYRAMDGDDDE